MKKFIIIVILFIASARSFGQTQLKLNSVTSITLPLGTLSIARDNASRVASSIFNNDKGASIQLSSGYPNVFRVGNVAFKINTSNKSVKPGHLEDLKNSFDKVLNSENGYISSIINVNGKEILLRKYTSEVSNYSFICYNATNSAAITGLVLFNKRDEAQARLILDAILASIKFAGD